MSAPPFHLRPRAVHGARIGILMLDTGFERLPGDVGHAGTWDFPVLYRIVRSATQEALFGAGPEALTDAFVAAGAELVEMGADGLATTCGFLAAIHPELSRRLPVPIATSALMQIPMVQALLPPGARVGVVTADAAGLTPAHFSGVGAPADCPVAGLDPDGAFRRTLRENRPVADRAAQEAELLALVDGLVTRAPEVRALVLECTNLAPHSAAIARRFGLPVFDVVTLVNWFHAALAPRVFA